MYVNSLQVCLCVLLYHFYLLKTDIIRHTVPAECKLLSLGVSPWSLKRGILMCCLLLLRLLECFSNKVWFLSRLCQQILEQEIPCYVYTFTWNVLSHLMSTECWGDFNSKQLSRKKFLQNPFLGCLWSILEGKWIICTVEAIYLMIWPKF